MKNLRRRAPIARGASPQSSAPLTARWMWGALLICAACSSDENGTPATTGNPGDTQTPPTESATNPESNDEGSMQPAPESTEPETGSGMEATSPGESEGIDTNIENATEGGTEEGGGGGAAEEGSEEGAEGGTEEGGETVTEPPPEEGNGIEAEFQEIDGLVSVEAENYFEQSNTDQLQSFWYTFRDGEPAPQVECVTNTPCDGDNRPACNEYDECDPDSISPADASGGAYVEALPDRRRDDSEANTGNLGFVNNQSLAPLLTYRVNFTQTGRYYVWGHARGQGPAANGIHVGIDGDWPDNDLIDPSSMRMQFPGGWGWTQDRRGGDQHTGVSGTDEVSERDANMWLEVDEPGVHIIQWAMREDGLEFDKFILALDPDFEPEGFGPPETTL